MILKQLKQYSNSDYRRGCN